MKTFFFLGEHHKIHRRPSFFKINFGPWKFWNSKSGWWLKKVGHPWSNSSIKKSFEIRTCNATVLQTFRSRTWCLRLRIEQSDPYTARYESKSSTKCARSSKWTYLHYIVRFKEIRAPVCPIASHTLNINKSACPSFVIFRRQMNFLVMILLYSFFFLNRNCTLILLTNECYGKLS